LQGSPPPWFGKNMASGPASTSTSTSTYTITRTGFKHKFDVQVPAGATVAEVKAAIQVAEPDLSDGAIALFYKDLQLNNTWVLQDTAKSGSVLRVLQYEGSVSDSEEDELSDNSEDEDPTLGGFIQPDDEDGELPTGSDDEDDDTEEDEEEDEAGFVKEKVATPTTSKKRPLVDLHAKNILPEGSRRQRRQTDVYVHPDAQAVWARYLASKEKAPAAAANTNTNTTKTQAEDGSGVPVLVTDGDEEVEDDFEDDDDEDEEEELDEDDPEFVASTPPGSDEDEDDDSHDDDDDDDDVEIVEDGSEGSADETNPPAASKK
jgi:hypothetical protein